MVKQKEYEKLELKDDFMFVKVMQNEAICKEFLEHLMDIKIDNITYPERQKSLKITSEGKGVRLDVYVQDDEDVIYDAEMQQKSKKEISEQLPKRSRYYQGMIDLSLLEKGVSYQYLNETYIIFICTYDPFGKELYKYTFENVCKEDNSLYLTDGAKRVFFNVKGKKGNISEQTKAILEYIDKSSANDNLTKKLEKEVEKVRKNERWRREYMKTLLHDEEVRQEGRSEGLREGRQEEIFISVQEGDYSVERGAQKLKLPVEDFTRQMESAGYCIPIK